MPSPVCHTSLLTDEHPVVAVGRQLLPRVAVEHRRRRDPWPRAMRTRCRRCRRRRARSRASSPGRVGDADLDVRLVGKPLCRRAIHADSGQHAAGEVVGAVHPHRGVGQLHDRRLEVGGVVVGAGLVGGLRRIRRPSRWRRRARPVAAPTVRRLSCHAAPGGPVNTVGAIADSCGKASGVSASEPRIRSGLAALIAVEVRLHCACPRRARRARRCRDRTAGWSSRRAARRRRCATAAPARTARRAGRPTAPRCAAGRPRTLVLPAAWRTSRSGGPRIERSGFGCARFVGPALIAQHARAGDLGGAGDDRLLRRPAVARVAGAMPQPLASVTTTAVERRPPPRRRGPARGRLISTSPTVTSGRRASVAAASSCRNKLVSGSANRIRQFVGPMPTRAAFGR